MKAIITILLFTLAINISKSETIAEEPLDTDGNGYRNISTLAHLRWLSETEAAWSENYELDNEIDAGETREWNIGDHDDNPATPDSAMGWKPIGEYKFAYPEKAFTGNFSGFGYRISNIYINRPNEDAVGFFGCISSGINISHLDIENIEISARDMVGGFVGIIYNSAVEEDDYFSDISYCSASSIIKGHDKIGGFVGEVFDIINILMIKNCYSNSELKGNEYIGGFCGQLESMNSGVNISDSFSKSKIIGGCYVAGFTALLTQKHYSYSLIERCYAKTEFVNTSLESGFCRGGKSFDIRGDSKNHWYTNSEVLDKSGNAKRFTDEDLNNDFLLEDWGYGRNWGLDIGVNGGFPYLKPVHIDFIAQEPFDLDADGFLDICSIAQFQAISMELCRMKKKYELNRDIDVLESKRVLSINPIEFYYHYTRDNLNDSLIFEFKGNGHSIKNLSVSSSIFDFLNGPELIKIYDLNFDKVKVFGEAVLFYNLYTVKKCILSNVRINGFIDGVGPAFLISEINLDHDNELIIENCSVKGNVSGIHEAALLISRIHNNGGSVVIKNCEMEGDISSINYCGGLASIVEVYNGKFDIQNCDIDVSINSNISSGGMICYLDNLFTSEVSIKNCSVKSKIKTDISAGGLIGTVYSLHNNSHLQIDECSSDSEIEVENGLAVGVIAEMLISDSVEISNTYSISKFISAKQASGFVNYSYYEDGDRHKLLLSNCYSVSKLENIHSFYGFSNVLHSFEEFAVVNSCYWDEELCRADSSYDGEGRSTTQMKNKSNYEGWDFVNIWDIDTNINDGYPYLRTLGPVSFEDNYVERRDSEIKVYPNPAAEFVNISFKNGYSGEVQITLVDLNGREYKLYAGVAHDGLKLNISEFPVGRYYLRTCYAARVESLPIVIE